MTDETRKEQEKKDELTEKDLDKASGGGGGHTGAPDHHDSEADKSAERRRL